MKVKLSVVIDIKDDPVDITKIPKEVFEKLDESYYVDEVWLEGKVGEDE